MRLPHALRELQRPTIRGLLVALISASFAFSPRHIHAADFRVNSPADVADANPGDGFCETAFGNGVCTLRAAIMETNALTGADTIELQGDATYYLSAGVLPISDSVAITGGGPDGTIIDGNGSYEIFSLTGCRGGGICDASHPLNVVSLTGVTLQNGSSVTGAGMYTDSATVTIDHCRLAHNHVLKYGGAIYSKGILTITNSAISYNDTAPSPGGGGGIYSFGTTVVRNSLVDHNSAVTGGGIDIGGGTLSVVSSTISDNSSTGDGGGIAVAGGTLGLYNATVVGNTANADESGTAIGAGIATSSTGNTVTFVNSIVAFNANVISTMPTVLEDDNCSGILNSQGNNILSYVDGSHCTITGPGASIEDPGIGSLQDNGGPTPTYALLASSPAIDGGAHGGCTDNLGAVLTTDQRGSPRPNGRYCDIGAYEAFEFIFRNGFE